jgi:hypothetical protein
MDEILNPPLGGSLEFWLPMGARLTAIWSKGSRIGTRAIWSSALQRHKKIVSFSSPKQNSISKKIEKPNIHI